MILFYTIILLNLHTTEARFRNFEDFEDFHDYGDTLYRQYNKKREASEVIEVMRDKQDCLFGHNHVRKFFKDHKVTWNEDLAMSAEKWAIHNIVFGGYYHSDYVAKGYGENLQHYMGGGIKNCHNAIYDWYREEAPKFVEQTGVAGHFKQLIWSETKEIGVGIAYQNGRTMIVARYKPIPNQYFNENHWNAYFHETNPVPTFTLNDFIPPKHTTPLEMAVAVSKPTKGNWPVNGGWTEWAQATKCSEGCTYMLGRFCTKPVPLMGGLDCTGLAYRRLPCSNCKPGCVNKRKDCENYAKGMKYCTNKMYIPFMQRDCRLACEFCQG